MHISHLFVYPVKSLKGIGVEASVLHSEGLAWDRRWMLVDEEGHFVTQRQLPPLAAIATALTETTLVLSHPRGGAIEVPLAEPQGPLRDVQVWKSHCKAFSEGDAVNAWLADVLGEAGRGLALVRFAPAFPRPVEPDFLDGQRATTYFADGYPFLMATQGSLKALNAALNERGQADVGIERFRPNIVIDGAAPWAEDSWQRLSVQTHENVSWTLRKPCQRCKIVTIDPATADIPVPGEPLKTLLALKTQPALKGAYFGQNATLERGEGTTLRVGMQVTPSA